MIATTEQVLKKSQPVDALALTDAAKLMASSQLNAAEAVGTSASAICSGAIAMADAIRSGHSLYYTAAGSSGLMAAADAMELGGTFNIPSTQVHIVMAGGLPTSAVMPGATEDTEPASQLNAMQQGDVMIAVSASGGTPFTVAAARTAKAKGVTVIGIANNEHCHLLNTADIKIFLPTPPEVIAGSTRLGAGTAQKIALNMLSSLMAIQLGHVHNGMMVNLRADNDKLRQRAQYIVEEISQQPSEVVDNALLSSNGNVKLATLIALGHTRESAESLLKDSEGQLHVALKRQTTQDKRESYTGESVEL